MSEFSMFLATIVGGGLFLLIVKPLADALLRVGLWMNGLDRTERNRIMEWWRTGRLPE